MKVIHFQALSQKFRLLCGFLLIHFAPSLDGTKGNNAHFFSKINFHFCVNFEKISLRNELFHRALSTTTVAKMAYLVRMLELGLERMLVLELERKLGRHRMMEQRMNRKRRPKQRLQLRMSSFWILDLLLLYCSTDNQKLMSNR